MTGEQICDLARTQRPLPGGLRLSEQSLYYTMRGIYRAYAAKELSLDQAKAAKADAIREFDSISLGESVYIEHARRMSEISRVLLDAEKHGCEHCKLVARLFDGRQNAWTVK